MQIDFLLLSSGAVLLMYGGLIVGSPRFAAYMDTKSLNKYLFPPDIAKFVVQYIDGSLALGLGAAMVLVAFMH